MDKIGDGKLISRDFRLYFTAIQADTENGVFDALATTPGAKTLREYINLFNKSAAGYTLSNLLATKDAETDSNKVWQEFGELRKDGFVSNLDDGETVEGNTKGEILVSQNGSITATMISLNEGTLSELSSNSGNDICVLAVSEDDSILAFFYPDLRLNFNPSVTGGEIGTIEVTFNKDVACGDDWSIPFTTYVEAVEPVEEGE